MKKFLFATHRILGTLLSLLFLMWFLTGMVMMYHSFPTLGSKANKYLVPLQQGALPDLNILRSVVPDGEEVRGLELKMFRNSPVFVLETKGERVRLSADSALSVVPDNVPYAELESYAHTWNSAPIYRVDTLRRLDQWIPYSHFKEHFPIYKFFFKDKERHYLYLSSVTGEPLQYVDKSQRFWAWLGPIPHMLYLWQWRSHKSEWITGITIVTSIGMIMCLTGIIVGIIRYVQVYRHKKKWRTPYRKFYFKWHHIFGFIFGFFVFMFVFSGMMSFNDLPQWAVKTQEKGLEGKVKRSTPIDINAFTTDYRRLLDKNPGEVKAISFEQYGEKAYFSTIIGGTDKKIDAQGAELTPLYLTEDDVLGKVTSHTYAPVTIELMEEFDNYYVGFTKRMKLPVYKVAVDDADKSTFYIDPESGYTRFFNNNLRAKKWIYPAFHSLRFKFFVEHKLLRDVVLWTLLLGGTVVSFTGVVMGCKYIARLARRTYRRWQRARTRKNDK